MAVRRRAALAALVAAASVLGACADDGPPVTEGPPVVTASSAPGPVAPGTAPTSPPAPPSGPASTDGPGTTDGPDTTDPSASAVTTPAPDTPPTDPRPPLTNGSGENEAYNGVGQLVGFGSSCTAFLLDVGPPSGPAYALTNGHCVGLVDSTSVARDQPADGAVVRFGLFTDTPGDVAEVPVASVRYATMRGTDVAVLQLASTRSAVIGLAAYSLVRPPAAADEVRVVGVPVGGVGVDEQVLRGATCTAGATVRLVELEWLWDAAVASDCAGILGGSSGSPMFDADDPTRVVGIVNTTTIGAPADTTCFLGQPCELSAAGAVTQADRTYAMPVDPWSDCFAPGWDPTAEGCPVEHAPTTVDAPQRAVRTGGTWGATIGGGISGSYQAKTGPAGTTDCRVPDGYAVTGPTFADPLPAAEGVYVLCAAALDERGRPDTTQAGTAVMVVDDTAPDAPIALSQVAQDGGVGVQPIVAPPEHASFALKVGRRGEVDCADLAGYANDQGVPLVVAAADLPATLCVVARDEAGNTGAAQSFELT